MSKNFDERKKSFHVATVSATLRDHDDEVVFAVQQKSSAPFITLEIPKACVFHMSIEDARAFARALAEATNHADLWRQES